MLCSLRGEWLRRNSNRNACVDDPGLGFILAATRGVCRFASVIALALFAATIFGIATVAAQVVPKSLTQPQSDKSSRADINDWTVGIVGGLFSGTYMRFAVDLAQALDDGNNLRILPIVSFGAASNLDDLLYLHGVDVAITQSDVFDYFRNVRKIPNLSSRVNYIIRLPLSEVHILARDDVGSIEALRGKTVNLGPIGSASSLTGAIIFQRLGIPIKEINLSYPLALEKLKSGEISALVRVVGKPVAALTRIPAGSGLHLLSIPFSKKFADYYTLGELSHRDYPNLIPAGQEIDTIAVPAVLAVYNWPRGSNRYRKVRRFVRRLFENFGKLQHPPYHPKWRDVNLAATVPGWTRFRVAKEMLQQVAKSNSPSPEELKQAFDAFLSQNGNGSQPSNKAQRDVLFREFMAWRRRNAENAH